MSRKPRVIITRKKLDTLHNEFAGFLRVGFVRGMTSLRRDIDVSDILQALKKNSFAQLRIDIEKAVTDVLDPLLGKAIKQTAQMTIEEMSELSDRNYRLTPSNPKVQAYIDSRTRLVADGTNDGIKQAVKATARRSTLITTLNREPKLGESVNRMVTRSLNVGMTLEQRAAMIRDSIGLNDQQAIALSNFRNRQVADGVSGSKLLARVAAQNDKMLDYRADMIARQETRNAQNASQLAVWQQASDDELIPKGSKKVWHCEIKPCEEWCKDMRNVGVLLDEPWVVRNTRTGVTVEVDIPSEVHVHCACSQSIDTGF